MIAKAPWWLNGAFWFDFMSDIFLGARLLFLPRIFWASPWWDGVPGEPFDVAGVLVFAEAAPLIPPARKTLHRK